MYKKYGENTYTTNIHLLQKRVIRIIIHNEYLASTSELFVKFNILKLNDIVKYKSNISGFKAVNGKL